MPGCRHCLRRAGVAGSIASAAADVAAETVAVAEACCCSNWKE